MQEAEEEIKNMTDCLSTRRIRGKDGDKVRTERKVQKYLLCVEQRVSDARPNLGSNLIKHFCHNSSSSSSSSNGGGNSSSGGDSSSSSSSSSGGGGGSSGSSSISSGC